MDSQILKTPALGRPFTLGMLYDAREDRLIPSMPLWDLKTLHEKTTKQRKSSFRITTSDSFQSKSSLLDVNPSLKASFLGGLIEVSGSAKYLNDNKQSHHQGRVTLQYKATTNFKQFSGIDLATLETQQKDLISQGCATHVVTGIKYGANAFLVFDSEKLDSDDSSVQNIQGSMETVIKKIPSFNVEGKVDIKLSEAEKALTDKFSCKFFGDFILDSNPATFKDAVKTYAELPKLLGEDGENSVPMVVWLMPLTHFDPEADEMKGEISTGLLRKVEDALEDLREIEMRCNDSQDEKVVEHFPQIREDLNNFQELCGYYKANLQKIMTKTLPSIRAGTEDESSIEMLLEDRDKSPFSNEKLNEWMDHSEREINVIRACVDTMEGMKFVQSQSELDREVLAPGVEDALCLVFTSLADVDPYLDAMTAYLDSSEDPVQVESPDEDLWYYSAEVIKKIREKAYGFRDLAKALKNNRWFCLLVASLPNEKYRGATIYQYKDGILVNEDFSQPKLPDVKTITNRRDLIWYACNLTLDPDTAHTCLTLSEGNKKVTYEQPQTDLPDNPKRFDTHPQVLCNESLKVRHYWEVEMSSGYEQNVYVAVAHKGAETKGPKTGFGDSSQSWCFGKSVYAGKNALYAYHNGKLWKGPIPSSCGFNRVGVYLDWPAGTLSFYTVSANTLSHLYTFRDPFSEPVTPGFLLGREGNFAFLNLAE